MASLRSMVGAVIGSLLVAIVVGTAHAEPQQSRLDEARQLFDQLRYEDAVPVLSQFLQELQARPSLDAEGRAQKAAALELRARSRFGFGDRNGARDDLRDLLVITPGYAFSGSVSPRLTALLDEVRVATVGAVALTVEPADAAVDIDGESVVVAPGKPLALAAGTHKVSARKPGFKLAELDITITAGATQPATVTLERTSAVIIVFTSPPGVMVSLNGQVVGATRPGPAPDAYKDWLVRSGYDPANLSSALEIPDVPTGRHELRFELPCHETEDYAVDVPRPADYRIDPTVMKPTVGIIRVPSLGSAEGTVLLDGQPKGPPPIALSNVCAGPHTVEVRSPMGMLRSQLALKAGDDVTLTGELRPSIAVLSTTGVRPDVPTADILAASERLYASSRVVTVFAPPADHAARAMAAQRVAEGWLARVPPLELGATTGADALAETSRRDAAQALCLEFGAQAVGELVFSPSEGGTTVSLRMVGRSVGRPDSVDVFLDSAPRSVAALEADPIVLTRPTLGLEAFDIADVDGVVVGGVAAGAGTGLSPGDVLTTLNDGKLSSVADLDRALTEQKPGDRVRLGVRDKAGAVRTVEWAVTREPVVASVLDRHLAWNKRLIELRARLAALQEPLEVASGQLNLAVALIRLGNWVEARDLLTRVRLATDAGVGRGAILYLQGLCAEALGDPSGALAAFRAAAAVDGALLTQDGPRIAALAEEAEHRLGGAPRRDEPDIPPLGAGA